MPLERSSFSVRERSLSKPPRIRIPGLQHRQPTRYERDGEYRVVSCEFQLPRGVGQALHRQASIGERLGMPIDTWDKARVCCRAYNSAVSSSVLSWRLHVEQVFRHVRRRPSHLRLDCDPGRALERLDRHSMMKHLSHFERRRHRSELPSLQPRDWLLQLPTS
jgi:hypothetical protein